MTDLPRFHTGSLGSLTFDDLNEVMKRLDLLRPLVESAGVNAVAGRDELVTVFPVTAKAIEEEDVSVTRYEWTEIVVDEDDEVVESADDETRIRSGGQIDSSTGEVDENYAVLADAGGSVDGVAICCATRRSDGRLRYLLTPTSGTTTCDVLVVQGDGTPVQANVEDGAGILGYKYGVSVIRFTGDETTGVRVGGASLFDWSANLLNKPVSKTEVTTSYHILQSGTCITGLKADGENYHLGTISRLDWECV